MNQRIEEGSEALTHRGHFPTPISALELEALKVAIATHEGFVADKNDVFDRTDEDWIGMEQALGECYIAVFHHYKTEQMIAERTIIFVLSPEMASHYQVWQSHQENLSDLEPLDQADEVRS